MQIYIKEVEDEFKEKLAEMVEATQELNTLLDIMEALAESQGMRQPLCLCSLTLLPLPCATGHSHAWMRQVRSAMAGDLTSSVTSQVQKSLVPSTQLH